MKQTVAATGRGRGADAVRRASLADLFSSDPDDLPSVGSVHLRANILQFGGHIVWGSNHVASV